MIHSLNNLVRRQIPVALTVSTSYRITPEVKVLYSGDDPEILVYIREFMEKIEEDKAAAVRLIWELAKTFL